MEPERLKGYYLDRNALTCRGAEILHTRLDDRLGAITPRSLNFCPFICLVVKRCYWPRNLRSHWSWYWFDRLGGGSFKPGWDSERKRQVVASRVVHVEDGSVGNAKRYHAGLDLYLDYMNAFGSVGVQLADAGFDEPSSKSLAEAGLHLIGSPQ
jgi:hypothetical protein